MASRRHHGPDEAPRGRPGWGAGRRRRGHSRPAPRESGDPNERSPHRSTGNAPRDTDEPAGHRFEPPAAPPPPNRRDPGRAEPPYPWEAAPDYSARRRRSGSLPPLPPDHPGRRDAPDPDEHDDADGPDEPGPGDPGSGTTDDARERRRTDPPRKLTVTRVAAWRGRDLTQRAMRLFFSAAEANGADRSGLAKFTYVVMFNYALDAVMAVALANTLFFSAATAESKTKVALYLLITVAPFAVIAPVIGPALDKLQHGRRAALAVSFGVRVLLAGVMALNFTNWLLYPAALGCMVLSKSFTVLKAAMTPRVLPDEITLTTANSRLTTFGMAAGGVFGAIASGFAAVLGSEGALWFMAAMAVVGVALSLRIPEWVESTEGEVPATITAHPHGKRRSPLGPHVVVALWGNGGIRLLTGFLTLFAAFVIKHNTSHEPFTQLVLLGLVGGAAGAGSFLGNAAGARMSFDKPDRLIVSCLGAALAVSACAAVLAGLTLAVVVGLVGASASALAKVCLDAVVQRDMPEPSRASAFGRSETVLQLSWVAGGALGVLLPPVYWVGFTVVAVLLALVLAQTVATGQGGSLLRPRRAGTDTRHTARPQPGAETAHPGS